MGNLVSAQARTQKNLEHAALKGNVADAKFYVERAGADPLLMDSAGWNALHHACVAGHLPIVEYFVDALRCSVHAPNIDRSTPLMLAVTAPNALPLVEFLLRRGALPNEQQKEGLTALHLAAIMRVPQVVTLLRRHAASITLRDDQDRLARDLCDTDETREAFDAPVVLVTADPLGFASASSDDDDDPVKELSPGANATVSREHIEALCNQLHTTFANVVDLAALDEMIAFYAAELHSLKNRRRKISRQKRNVPAKTTVSTTNDDNDDDDDHREDDVDGDDGGKEMLPLIDN